ncbi:lipopolysaccharide kinase InaA family protein [Legionella sp. D16C41]|uniref:lipopolysaccharide kinase InaA family protein n=1 Tax=Legionella sp. D16C41 TaxID=3402688 RepID=UPI003AF7A3D7
MFRYKNKSLSRVESFIEDEHGVTYFPIAKPSAGFSADNRFFGRINEKNFLVKRPKYYDKFGEFNAQQIKQIDKAQEESYRLECERWNLVYPNNKACLFTEDGLRLVLPCLPGKNLSECLSDDELIRCKQLLSVAYAIQKFHNLGFTYTDFNLDNVLLEEKSEGVFQAYLIDFNDLDTLKDHMGAKQELCAISHLLPGADWHLQFNSSEKLISYLTDKIEQLENCPQERSDFGL